jgi:hypothetical protein
VKILVDEQTPVLYVKLLEFACPGHEVKHVDEMRWKGKPDKHLLPDAAKRGFDVILTNDHNQLSDPVEVKAIKRSKLHHVRYAIPVGPHGLSRALASVAAAMPTVMDHLAVVTSQRVVKIKPIPGKPTDRFEMVDPNSGVLPYWR